MDVRASVTGCYNPPWLPADSYTKFHIDRLVVVCNYSSESFVLICVETNGRRQWIGELKNCSKPPGQCSLLTYLSFTVLVCSENGIIIEMCGNAELRYNYIYTSRQQCELRAVNSTPVNRLDRKHLYYFQFHLLL